MAEGLAEDIKNAKELKDRLDAVLVSMGKQKAEWVAINDLAEERKKVLVALHKDNKKITQDLLTQAGISKKLGDLTDEIAAAQAEWENHLRDTNTQAARFEKTLIAILSTTEESLKVQKDTGKTWEESNEHAKKNLKLWIDTTEEAEGQKRHLQDMLGLAKKTASMNTKAGKAAVDQQKAIAAELNEILKKGKDLTNEDLARIGNLERQLKISEELEQSAADMVAKFGSLKAGGLKGFLSGAGMAKEGIVDKLKGGGWKNQENVKGAGQALDIMGKDLGGTLGKVFSGLGGVVTKALGPIMWAVTAIMAVVDKIIELDNFRKEQINAFQKMAGPQFDGDKFAEDARTFTDAVFNAERNLRLGVNAKEWQEMFKAFQAGGMTFESLQKQVGTYGQVMEAARTISLEFGTDVQTAGSMLTDMATTANAPLEEMKDSFHAIALGAKKAGMSSDKFYGVIKQSTLALGTYGNFLKQAEKTLQSFAKTGLSQEDAMKAAGDATQIFSGKQDLGSLLMKSQLMQTGMGSGNMKSMLQKSLGTRTARLDELRKTKGGTETKEYKQLLLAVNKIDRAVKSNDPTLLAGAFTYTMENQGEALRGMIKGALGGKNVDLTSGETFTPEMYAQLTSQLGVTKEMVDAEQSKELTFIDASDRLSKSLEGNTAAQEELANDSSLMGMLQDPEKAKQEDIDALLKKYADKGLDVSALADVINNPKAAQDLLKAFKKDGIKAFKQARTIAKDNAWEMGSLGDEQSKNAARMIKDLTPIEKSMGITKEALQWYTASSGPAEASAEALYAINKKVGSILGSLTGGAEEKSDKTFNDAMDTIKGLRQSQEDADSIGKKFSGMSADDLDKYLRSGNASNSEVDFFKQSGYVQKAAGGIAASPYEKALSGPIDFSRAVGKVKGGLETKIGETIKTVMQDAANSETGANKAFGVATESDKAYGRSLGGHEKELMDAAYGKLPEKHATGILGGVVGGGRAGTDSVPALLTPGELVANAGDQKVIADLIRGSYGPTPMTASGLSPVSGRGASTVNVAINVTGTSGDEVVAIIERKLKQQSFWNSMTS